MLVLTEVLWCWFCYETHTYIIQIRRQLKLTLHVSNSIQHGGTYIPMCLMYLSDVVWNILGLVLRRCLCLSHLPGREVLLSCCAQPICT